MLKFKSASVFMVIKMILQSKNSPKNLENIISGNLCFMKACDRHQQKKHRFFEEIFT